MSNAVSVSVSEGTGKITVRSPYNDGFNTRARQLGGKWNSEARAWMFGPRYEEQVRDLCRDVYGTDGTPTPVVTVRVALDHTSLGAELVLGPVMVLRKMSRDAAPVVGEGCAVIAGRLKEYGGSMRYPAITWVEGTVVEAANVPILVAQKLVARDPAAYQIVDAPAADDALTPEEQSLLATLRSLSPERRAKLLAKLGE